MKLIALLAGLLIERVATQLFHLRQLRWLDSVIDAGFARTSRISGLSPLAAVLLLGIVLVLPVAFLLYLFADLLYSVGYLLIAVVVLFFSLGPKDIGEQVDDYCSALEAGDEAAIRRTAKALLETQVPDDAGMRTKQVEQAVCVQANNRLFAVIFWFVLFGPIGAWAFRVSDLIRRRAVFARSRADADVPEAAAPYTEPASRVHAWLAFVPARLTALGYALAGSFDKALAAWRDAGKTAPGSLREQNEALLARVGVAALDLDARAEETAAERGVRGATAANGLVFRLLGIWAVAIAAMTLYGWSI